MQKTLLLPIEGTIIAPIFNDIRAEVSSGHSGVFKLYADMSFCNGWKNSYTDVIPNCLHTFVPLALADSVNGIDFKQNRDAVMALSGEYQIAFHSNIGRDYNEIIEQILAKHNVCPGLDINIFMRRPNESLDKAIAALIGNIPANVIVVDNDIKNLYTALRMNTRPIFLSPNIVDLSHARSRGFVGYKSIADFAANEIGRRGGR